ncbi:hypothetical protein ADIMK_0351 [Marinobacterium lacunae]|uniref:Peptidoglycan binding-like domain-containing protein n=1 Tax=Marinobacterium lacunae TaxID=1232683 RepID=A0A081G3N9_9GAMM|nr:SEL1-like repeat protein [Marinobacterium lacunae]KEA65394.1 hypothetical protein ADIMK_0351 [Marinobacterium lacunae]
MRLTLALALTGTLMLGGCSQLQLIGSTDSTRELAEKASDGDVDSQYLMGLHFTTGADASQDYARGLRYFEDAAKAGHADSQYMLGMGYYLGRGTAQDYPEAKKWLELAAYQGHREAMHYLGEIYFNGYGTQAEPSWGIHWIGQAAERGYSEAQYLLGTSYLTGIGSVKNRAQGLRWLSIASNNGSLRAKELLEQIKQQPRRYSFTAITSDLTALKKRYQIRFIQTRLSKLGYNPGPTDGVWGERTANATSQFMKRNAPITEVIEALRRQPEKI